MVKYIISIILMLGLVKANAQQTSAIKAWENLLDKSDLAEYFTDVFIHLGIHINETGEELTVNHEGDHFTLTKGIDKQKVDYIANINLENVENMKKHGADEVISEEESYRILSVLFTPLTRASLNIPMMEKPLLRMFAGIENHIHVHLINPENEEINSHTLIFVNKQWIVADGIHGNAKRVFKLPPAQALEYQKRFFRAMTINKGSEWRSLKKWYKKWRKTVSEEI